ncbi:formaldehyde-activating enzyme [Actinomycetospora cinnamomea]|uniref:Formaldehyde activating enzyme n=1 Tax=Actinomycetospora cinnamomea TaxID=663609 RepID=A0A2U1EAW9_9PSEU|nr:formaldehyde-activating enzyme [Actinomycetospora cinnamomea]PVY97091.1 formaldehyde activating enzyme [Actinomycetospora cinnamomea]
MSGRSVDGRLSQGWGGTAPNGVHVNVVLAERASPTAAALTTAFAAPRAGFTPILVSLGPDQPSYETLLPPTVMLNKVPVEDERFGGLVAGACQVGIARAVLDTVAAGLLEADQETVVFVSLWLDTDAQDEQAVCAAAREATAAALREAVEGRDPDAARALVDGRESVTHPFYGG